MDEELAAHHHRFRYLCGTVFRFAQEGRNEKRQKVKDYMKKLLTAMLLAMAAVSANAQFEKGTKYVGASFTGLNMSVSDKRDFALGINLQGGYFLSRDWMAEGLFGFNCSKQDLDRLLIGAKMRYYTRENGLFYAAGLQYVHEKKNFNDLQLTPELGYCFYMNHYVSIEPALYLDMSLTDTAHKSELGVKVGIGIYF